MKNFMMQLSLRNKLLCILLVIMLIFSGFSIFLIQSLDEINEVTNTIKKENLPTLVWYNHWEKELAIKKSLVETQLKNDSKEIFIRNYLDFDEDFSQNQFNETMELPIELIELNNRLILLDFIITNKVMGLLDYEEVEAAKGVLEKEYLPELIELQKVIMTNKEEEMQAFDKNSEAFPIIIEKSIMILLVLTFIGVLTAIYFSYRVSKNMSEPIVEMVQKVNHIANGNYDVKLDEPSQIEFRSLAKSITQMSLSLQQSFQKILHDKVKHEEILNSLPIGIITYDETEKEYMVNSFVKKILQIDAEKLQDKRVIPQLRTNPLLQLFFSKDTCLNKKITIELNQQHYVFLVSQVELNDYMSVKTGKIFYFIDITESALLEERIIKSEKLALVGEMAASSAHEIRNPLTVIHGFLTLMQESLNKEQLEQFNFRLMMKEIERLYSIVEQMLLMSKQKPPEMRPTDLNEVLNDLFPLLNGTFKSKSIDFIMNLTNQCVLADSKQLKQVFLNLIRNSIEAIGSNGKITISAFEQQDDVYIRIQDNGEGVPDSIKRELFEPFSTSKSNGTGLGLNVVKTIIENHQGSIELYTSDNTGTTFQIRLPICSSTSNRFV
ncbi:ATP-binding protein [Gracilibacillus marinus]|uniref:histidine kinase n=1 Tax=Gracilibacillus marinus TaxID=630535 RepID=A0ABV8VZE8_9BACI